MSAPFVVFLRAEAWDARWLAVSAALSAAALGAPVQLALFGAPLRAFVDGGFDAGSPSTAGALGVDSLAATLTEARVLGLRVVACDTALRLAGLEPSAVVPPLDAVVSLPSLLRDARGGTALSF